jgi:hypothetical protein
VKSSRWPAGKMPAGVLSADYRRASRITIASKTGVKRIPKAVTPSIPEHTAVPSGGRRRDAAGPE